LEKDSKIFIAGFQGLAGSAIMRILQSEGYNKLLLRTHKELDLEIQSEVWEFFEKERPDYVFLAAAKVGGILANSTYPADFIYRNLIIEANVIHASYKFGVSKLLFLGSSCIYPKHAPQPMKEEYLLTGELEPTNEWYAIAKIVGIKMCQAYRKQYDFNAISLMPTNLYGPGDNFDLQNSHVLPALIRKFHEAKVTDSNEVAVWGSGTPRREFLHVDDLADAALFLMENYDSEEIVNVGVGEDITIKDLAILVKDVVEFEGDVVFDDSKPDGTPRKLLDVSRLQLLGWEPKVGLKEGIKKSVEWYREHYHV
jgi:GDP-L-fucose synthase